MNKQVSVYILSYQYVHLCGQCHIYTASPHEVAGTLKCVLQKNVGATGRLCDEINVYEAGAFLGCFEKPEPPSRQTVQL